MTGVIFCRPCCRLQPQSWWSC